MDIQLRPMQKSDVPFITNTWFRSHWKAIKDSADFNAYERVQNAAMHLLLQTAETTVAFIEAAPDEILGFAIHTPNVLHYIYVKKDYRRHGIATKLTPNDIHTTTFRGSSEWGRFRRKRIPKALFSSQYVPALLLGEADRVRQAIPVHGSGEADALGYGSGVDAER